MTVIPFGNETVTLVRRSVTADSSGKSHATYSNVILRNCSWRRTVRTYQNEGAVMYAETVTVRVPHEQTRPCEGNIIRGSISAACLRHTPDISILVTSDGNVRFSYR